MTRAGACVAGPSISIQINWIEDFKEGLEALKWLYPNGICREIAKQYNALSILFLSMEDMADTANYYYAKGVGALLADRPYTNPIPTIKQCGLDNTIIELLETKANMYASQYEQSKNWHYLDSSIMAIERIIAINNHRRQNWIGDGDKLIVIKESKQFIGIPLRQLAEIQRKFPKHFDINRVRKVLDFSKALLLNENAERARAFQSLSGREQAIVDELILQYRIYNSYNYNLSAANKIKTEILKRLRLSNAEKKSKSINHPFIEYS